MPRGGKREGAGRKLGSRTKNVSEVKEAARKYGVAAIEALAELAGLTGSKPAESEQVRVSASTIILDRGFGRPTQAIAGDPEHPIEMSSKIEYVIIDTGVPRHEDYEPKRTSIGPVERPKH